MFLPVLSDIVDGYCILTEMDLVALHPSYSLQDSDILYRAKVLGSSSDSLNMVYQIILGFMYINDLTVTWRNIF